MPLQTPSLLVLHLVAQVVRQLDDATLPYCVGRDLLGQLRGKHTCNGNGCHLIALWRPNMPGHELYNILAMAGETATARKTILTSGK